MSDFWCWFPLLFMLAVWALFPSLVAEPALSGWMRFLMFLALVQLTFLGVFYLSEHCAPEAPPLEQRGQLSYFQHFKGEQNGFK